MTGFTFAQQKLKGSKWLLRLFMLFISCIVLSYIQIIHVCITFCDVKTRCFEKQFELAYATKLPMFLHMRAAAEDFCEILKRNKDRWDYLILWLSKIVQNENHHKTLFSFCRTVLFCTCTQWMIAAIVDFLLSRVFVAFSLLGKTIVITIDYRREI